MSADVSKTLYALLDEKLDTFEKLELVLMLRDAGTGLRLADLALALQVGPDALRRVTDDLIARDVICTRGDNLELCEGPWDAILDEAAHLLANEPSKLMRVFTRIGMAKIRGMAARSFADAFRIRKKGP